MKMGKRFARLFVLMVAVGLTAFAVSGCSGGGGSSSDGGGGGGSPEITLSTGQVAIGNVVANANGLRSADRSVEVQNTGTANLVIGQVAQANPLAAPFSIHDDNCSGVSLAPNASCTVSVRFAPTAPSATSFTDSFDIPSNDADEPSLTVSVSGDGKGLNVTINKVDTSAHPTIRMIVSVTDGDNNAVQGLLPGDFAVSEGGAGQVIAVDNTVQTAVSVALDLDYSLSITPVQDDVEEAAKGFLDQLNPATDEAAVIKFASVVRLAKDFTLLANPLDLQAVKDAIDAPYTDLTTSTKLFDAVFESIDRLDLRANDRLAAIVLSDGIDLINQVPASTHDLDEVIANAQDKKVFIFTIGLGNPIDTEVMQRMAVETGGQYFEAPSSADLNAIYTQISTILTSQYEITFNTTRPVGTLNTVQVVVTQPVTLLTGEDTESVTY